MGALSVNNLQSVCYPNGADFEVSIHYQEDGSDDSNSTAIVIDALGQLGRQLCLHSFTAHNKGVVDGSSSRLAAQILLGKGVAGQVHQVALKNDEPPKEYMDSIFSLSSEIEAVILHTASLKALFEVFKTSPFMSLKSKLFLTYSKENVKWDATQSEKVLTFQEFFQNVTKSGAKLVFAEGFSLFQIENFISSQSTPLLYQLIKVMDGKVGQIFESVDRNALMLIRQSQIKKCIALVDELMTNHATESQVLEIQSYLIKIHQLCSRRIPSASLPLSMNQLFSDNLHSKVSKVIEGFTKYLKDNGLDCVEVVVDGEKEIVEVERLKNIYLSASRDKYLIANSIPAIIETELLENRKNGFASQCVPVKFDGFNDAGFPKYVPVETSSIYYLDTFANVQACYPEFRKENVQKRYPDLSGDALDAKVREETDRKVKEITVNNLKYFEVCQICSLMTNPAFISRERRDQLMESEWGEQLFELAESVKELGYGLPKSYESLMSLT